VVPSSRERDEMSRVLILAPFGSSGFAQTTPNLSKKTAVQAKSKQSTSGCKFVRTVKGTKLWAGDCIAPEQLRAAEPASEPSLSDQAAGAIPAGQK